MTHTEAEILRSDVKNWQWGIIYNCPQDPRVIVRNRFVFGWTWNFGHPRVFIWIVIVVGFVIGIPFILAAYVLASVSGLLLVFFASLLVAMAFASYIASGPG